MCSVYYGWVLTVERCPIEGGRGDGSQKFDLDDMPILTTQNPVFSIGE